MIITIGIMVVVFGLLFLITAPMFAINKKGLPITLLVMFLLSLGWFLIPTPENSTQTTTRGVTVVEVDGKTVLIAINGDGVATTKTLQYKPDNSVEFIYTYQTVDYGYLRGSLTFSGKFVAK